MQAAFYGWKQVLNGDPKRFSGQMVVVVSSCESDLKSEQVLGV
jgi:hypothetical protein